MERIGRQIRVMPRKVREKFSEMGEEVYDFLYAEDNEQSEGTETDGRMTQEVTGGLGHDQFWYEACKVHQASQHCRT